jgi:steroid delta-isomerase-like uncharacterized protein
MNRQINRRRRTLLTDKKVWLASGADRGMGVDIAKAALAAGHAVVATARNTDTVTAADPLVLASPEPGGKPEHGLQHRRARPHRRGQDPPTPIRGDPVTVESNKRIMERFTREFLTTGDAVLAEEIISLDIVMHFAGQQQRGRDAYLAIVAANGDAFPDLLWTVEEMVAEGDTVAVRYTMTGTHRGSFAGVPPTDKAVVAQSMAFYRLADGKIVEERAQLDMLGVLQQLGAVPGAEKRASL